jgi:hypothetical protein
LIPVGQKSQEHIAELENDVYRRCDSIREKSVVDCRRKISDLRDQHRDQQETFAKSEVARVTADLKHRHAIEIKTKEEECARVLKHQSKELLPEINELAESMLREKDKLINDMQIKHDKEICEKVRRIQHHEKHEDKLHAKIFYLGSQMSGPKRDMSKCLPEMLTLTQRDRSSIQVSEARRRSFLAARCSEHPSSILDLERIVSTRDKEISKLNSTIMDLNEQVNMALELTKDVPQAEAMHRNLSRRFSASSCSMSGRFDAPFEGATAATEVYKPITPTKPKINRRRAVRQHISGDEELLRKLAAEPMLLPDLQSRN